MAELSFTWQGHEHEHRERSTDWFWALGIIAISSAIASIIFQNVLFAILILLIAFLLAMFAVKAPARHLFRIDKRGVTIDKTLYPYRSFEAFSVNEPEEHDAASPEANLVLRANRGFSRYLVIPIPKTVSSDRIRDYLAAQLDEEELHEPLSQRLLEFIGF